MLRRFDPTINKISLKLPTLFLVFSAIAIPVEFRRALPPDLSFRIEISDFLANIAGFIPVGIVLGEYGLWRAVLGCAILSTFAEACQTVMSLRFSGADDVLANVLGGLVGAAASVHWKIPRLTLGVNRSMAAVAAALALGTVGFTAVTQQGVNQRGITQVGRLEAEWKFDESGGRQALDSSGHGWNGKFHSEPKRVAGKMNGALMLDGVKDYVSFGHPTDLRLIGSMTVTAWIKPTSFPIDDAAVVSQYYGNTGYQLDTTTDKGPRTIGFKLSNSCGELMARYGYSALKVDVWYHIAGVYDAEARALNVYLDGQLDNGPLVGSVTKTQHCARADLCVGRRADHLGYEFAGAIDDVRIYSAALTGQEIKSVMNGDAIDVPSAHAQALGRTSVSGRAIVRRHLESPCGVLAESGDKEIPLAAAFAGTLAAVACVGLLPSSGPVLWLIFSLAAGLLFLPATAPMLPTFNMWLIPLVSLAGGASVALSVRRQPG